MRIVIASGGFDPLHSGHIAYLEAARKLGDKLIVGLNSDNWLIRKKGFSFMPFQERLTLVSSLRCVDVCLPFNDDDETACALIRRVLDDENEFIFANGGDRTAANIPEMELVCENLTFAFGVGGEDKKNSSSWITRAIAKNLTNRPWGFYQVLFEVEGMKVKRLVLNPKSQISYQRHFYRNEYWQVVDGEALVIAQDDKYVLKKNQTAYIGASCWHQIINTTEKPLEILEIQSGEKCIEVDIERKP